MELRIYAGSAMFKATTFTPALSLWLTHLPSFLKTVLFNQKSYMCVCVSMSVNVCNCVVRSISEAGILVISLINTKYLE